MRILITNDDGINSPWLEKLSVLASEFGEVTIVAPDSQRSATSQRITLTSDIEVSPAEVEGAVSCHKISGTPADCIRVALRYIMKEPPDYVFSGINEGYNTGFDIAYSGTVAAAMEALLSGVPAIAYSNLRDGSEDTIDRYFNELTLEILKKEPLRDRIWNVNFPGCTLEEAKGVLWNREIATVPVFWDTFKESKRDGDTVSLSTVGEFIDPKDTPPGSDIHAVINGYVSVGMVRSQVL